MAPYNNYPPNNPHQGQYPPHYQGQQGPQGPLPSNSMVWAILTTIFCCLPFGIVAIVYASKVDSLWYSGNHMAAYDAANKAKNWSIAAGVSGLVCGIAYIIFYFLLGISMMAL